MTDVTSIADSTAAWTAPVVARVDRMAAVRRVDPAPTGDDVRAQAAELEAARQAANRALAQKGRELAFEFNDELGQVVVKLIDKETHEVIRQIPSEAVLAIARALTEGGHTGSVLRVHA
jgi:flagellar protein FlaG